MTIALRSSIVGSNGQVSETKVVVQRTISRFRKSFHVSFASAATTSSARQRVRVRFCGPETSLRLRSAHGANVRAAAVCLGQETNFRISETFVELKKQSKVAFIPYVTAGDPDLETTAKCLQLLDNCGADIIELGIPYSDPLADGPVIHSAATRAINGGTNVDSVLTMMHKISRGLKAPIVIFLYYNPLLKRGVERFLEEAKAARISGLVVPDLPLEETGKLRKLTSAAGMELILLTTPTTPASRMGAIADATQGFVYLVSLTGVTGTRAAVEDRVEGLLKDIKKATKKPVAVGFGVSSSEQAAKLREWGADGVIIGSAVVKLLAESRTPEEGLEAVEEFARSVRVVLS